MFSLVFSNRYEILLEALLTRLGDQQTNPFCCREIIIPNAALRRSVELAVARREGVASNLRFSYLARWLWQQIDRVVPVGEHSPYAPPVLVWRIYALLDQAWVKEHPRLQAYLAAADVRMRYELAARLAALFDHYVTYRPDWLAAWAQAKRVLAAQGEQEKCADEIWQMALWQHILVSSGLDGLEVEQASHPMERFFAALELEEASRCATLLPQGVQVFCPPALPPLYLQMLRRLANWIDVRLYVLNPCQEYWFEIVSPRRLVWLRQQQREHYHESGNRLLAAWGGQTQAHIDLLFEGEVQVEDSLFCEAVTEASPSLLARVQDAILDLFDPPAGAWALQPQDRSIEVHVCHSLQRELEVLQDRLLELCVLHPDLRAEQIVVLTPDLDAAVPLIQSVFDSAPQERKLPWRISGQRSSRINPIARLLDSVLELMAGRCPVSGLFELLQQAPLAERFDLDEEALQYIHDWLCEAGVHWGLQAQVPGMVTVQRHSLEEGLQRLFLAYAAGGEPGREAWFGEWLGCGRPEEEEAWILGRLWRYGEQLRQLWQLCRQPRDAAAWRMLLLRIVATFVPDTASWREPLLEVQQAIDSLCDNLLIGGGSVVLPLEVVHLALQGELDSAASGGMPGGAVTFSAIGSLRALPYRVVCLIGLNDGVFPHVGVGDEFDLMQRFPRRGDRQRRSDERTLFLDLLLSARAYLHLSYCGRSVRDNSTKPPSVLVDDLLDYLVAATAQPCEQDDGRTAARRRLVLEHPLQAFSRTYFETGQDKDARLGSFNREYCQALQQPHVRPLPFMGEMLALPNAGWQEIELETLISFLCNPARFLLRKRLDVAQAETAILLEDDECFDVGRDEQQQLARQALPLLLAGEALEDIQALLRCSAEVPHGVLGQYRLKQELESLCRYAERLRPMLAQTPRASRGAEVASYFDEESWLLQLALSDVRDNGLVCYRYGKVSVRDVLSAWLRHLALCVVAEEGVLRQTVLLARDATYCWRAVEAAEEILTFLLSLYRQGLLHGLAFYPKSAWAWFSNGRNVAKAESAWINSFNPGFSESHDQAIRLLLRDQSDLRSALDERFYALAEQVFSPLWAHLEIKEGGT